MIKKHPLHLRADAFLLGGPFENRFRISLTRFVLALWFSILSVAGGTALIFGCVDTLHHGAQRVCLWLRLSSAP